MIRIYDNPSLRSYLTLLRLEAVLVQTAELHLKNGNHFERREILQAKKAVSIRRRCMKAALKLKEKSQQQATLYGFKTPFAIIDEVAEKGVR